MLTTALPAPLPTTGCLVEIIELKWLLAGHGMRIHVEQLLHDPEYARRTLDCAAGTASPVLRDVAARLRLHLGLGLGLAAQPSLADIPAAGRPA
jgi:hypothetical protein